MSLLLAIAIWFLIRNYIDDINRDRASYGDNRGFRDSGWLGRPDHDNRPAPKAAQVDDDESEPPPKATRVLESPPERQRPKKAIPVDDN